METLCFSRVLTDSGSYLKANTPVIVQGKLSVRDEKDPQIMVDRVLPLDQSGVEPTEGAKVLWIKLPDGEASFQWLKRLLDMFPGKERAIVYLEDSKRKLQTHCLIHAALLDELAEVLGQGSVVVKEK
jgi:DNA polymerase-3 subunit alpha